MLPFPLKHFWQSMAPDVIHQKNCSEVVYNRHTDSSLGAVRIAMMMVLCLTVIESEKCSLQRKPSWMNCRFAVMSIYCRRRR